LEALTGAVRLLLLALWVGLRLSYAGQKERRQECLRYWGGIAVRERMQLGGGRRGRIGICGEF